eukprot:TRINITY_DN74491_c0_g1_i1.p1 TRINITY_DN74491_c0_g1~~TRINITY_DN74491_c0_g1_i1.p1  ORF type:complete len:305 (+),score=41.38 TRINITY_DN74491_c0_g1_i1:137-1051(+)
MALLELEAVDTHPAFQTESNSDVRRKNIGNPYPPLNTVDATSGDPYAFPLVLDCIDGKTEPFSAEGFDLDGPRTVGTGTGQTVTGGGASYLTQSLRKAPLEEPTQVPQPTPNVKDTHEVKQISLGARFDDLSRFEGRPVATNADSTGKVSDFQAFLDASDSDEDGHTQSPFESPKDLIAKVDSTLNGQVPAPDRSPAARSSRNKSSKAKASAALEASAAAVPATTPGMGAVPEDKSRGSQSNLSALPSLQPTAIETARKRGSLDNLPPLPPLGAKGGAASRSQSQQQQSKPRAASTRRMLSSRT